MMIVLSKFSACFALFMKHPKGNGTELNGYSRRHHPTDRGMFVATDILWTHKSLPPPEY